MFAFFRYEKKPFSVMTLLSPSIRMPFVMDRWIECTQAAAARRAVLRIFRKRRVMRLFSRCFDFLVSLCVYAWCVCVCARAAYTHTIS